MCAPTALRRQSRRLYDRKHTIPEPERASSWVSTVSGYRCTGLVDGRPESRYMAIRGIVLTLVLSDADEMHTGVHFHPDAHHMAGINIAGPDRYGAAHCL